MKKDKVKGSLPVVQWDSGIWRIELPFGFGNVNVFLIEDDTLTLIDSGPPYPQSNKLLQKCLKQIGYTWKDIDLIILTHPHIDHMGGVAKLPDSPKIYAYNGTQELIGSYDKYIESVYFKLLSKLAHEYPELASTILTKQSEAWMYNYYCPGGDFIIHKEVVDGEIIDLGKRQLRVIHTPGHHKLHMSLFYEQRKILFSGDYILRGGPQISRLLGDDPEQFQNSIKQVKNLDIESVFPSHGGQVDPVKGIEHVESLVPKQIEKVRDALSDGGKSTKQLFKIYFGKKVPNEMIGVYFAGLDTYLNLLLNRNEIIKKSGIYYLNNNE